MACVHNQVKINDLNKQIEEKKLQICNLQDNITKCEVMIEKHGNFNKKIDCVINNLEGNTVVAGVSYDDGKMIECLKSSNETINDCDNIILKSKNQILLLEININSLKKSIASLQGNCYSCSIKNSEYGKV